MEGWKSPAPRGLTGAPLVSRPCLQPHDATGASALCWADKRSCGSERQVARSHRLVWPAGVAPARERQPGLEKIKVDWVPTVQFKRSPSPVLQGPLASAGSDGQVSPRV